MEQNSKIENLVVGAGPVGLAAALFLKHNGVQSRIVDAMTEPSPYSKALAVNPRTLEILEPVGVTKRMLEKGVRINGAQLWRNFKPLVEQTFESLHVKYPFMLGLSQATTERLLTEALDDLGISVERGQALTGLETSADSVKATLQSGETIESRRLFAADGSHSFVRKQLGIAFEGTSFPEPWYLVDVPMVTSIAQDRAHVFLLDEGGFLFVMRVVDDRQPKSADPIWRVMTNFPDPLAYVKFGQVTGAPIWSSNFRISHRINAQLSAGPVFFAGDAAHIHSPVGARGMNLGIEDAAVFAQLLKENRLDEYGALRRKVDRAVVKRVDLMSRVVSTDSWFLILLRSLLLPRLLKSSLVRDQVMVAVTGLDHPVMG